MGTSAASEPLNSFIIVIYDLWPTYFFLLLFHNYAFRNGRIDHFRIYLMIYLIDITNIDKIFV